MHLHNHNAEDLADNCMPVHSKPPPYLPPDDFPIFSLPSCTNFCVNCVALFFFLGDFFVLLCFVLFAAKKEGKWNSIWERKRSSDQEWFCAHQLRMTHNHLTKDLKKNCNEARRHSSYRGHRIDMINMTESKEKRISCRKDIQLTEPLQSSQNTEKYSPHGQ